MDNFKKSTNIPKKEKDFSLSLFRIPLNFFASEEDLDKFHKNLEKLKEKVFMKKMTKLEAKKFRKQIMKRSTPNPISRKFTYKGPSTLSTSKKSFSGETATAKIIHTDSNDTPTKTTSTPSTLETSNKQKNNDNLDNTTPTTDEKITNNANQDNTSPSSTSNSQESTNAMPSNEVQLDNTEHDIANNDELNIDSETDKNNIQAVNLEEDTDNSLESKDENESDKNKDEAHDNKDGNESDNDKDESKNNKNENESDNDKDESKNNKNENESNKNKDEAHNNKDNNESDNDNDAKNPDSNKDKKDLDKENSDENKDKKDPDNDKDKKDSDNDKDKKDSDKDKTPKSDSTDQAEKANKVADTADKAGQVADAAGNAADKAGKVADTADKAGQVADAAGNAAGGTVPGVGGVAKLVKDVNGVKDALNGDKDALPEHVGQCVVDGTQTAANALNAVAPGVGKAVSAGIGALDATIGQTEAGKSAKRKIGWCCSAGCLYSLILDLIILMLPLLLMHAVLDTAKQMIDATINAVVDFVDGVVDFFTGEDEEEKNTNFVFALEESTLNQKNKSIYTILDDTLEKIKYKEYKEALNNPDKKVQDVKPNASTYILPMITSNYSIGNLKEPALASSPNDFPDEDDNRMGNTYYSMESKHMALFQDVLDNRKEGTYFGLSDSDQEKATKLKNLFNYDKKMTEFIDGLTEKLDTTYNIFNPYENIYENNVSLRDLLDELSTQEGDANYHIRAVKLIFNDRTNNLELIEDFYTFQEEMGMLELMVYMQSYRQYQTAISDLRQKAVNGDFVLPDVYHTEEFFEQFSTITDVASYITLAQTTYTSSIAYEIACETINIWKDPVEISEKSYNGKTFAYIPVLETWYANYNFSLITIGDKAILKCDGYESRQIDENSWDNSSNLLKRYNIHDKEKFFELYKRATGTNPVEGEDNIYTPYGLDENWELDVDIETGSTKATSNAVAYSYATTEYLTENGGSIPLATNLLIVTQDFLEPYSQTTVDKFNLTHSEHRGIDYSVPSGTPILAMRDGTITKATYNNAYGYYVEITDSNGYKSKYAHGNGTFNVSVGQKVTSGTQIMESGNSGNSTGPHLHVEVHDASGNLVNPNVYAGLTL